MRLADHLAHALDDLRSRDLFRKPATVRGPQGRHVTIEGRAFLNFASNDYLGLAGHAALRAAAAAALRDDGVGTGASRLVSGDRETHRAAERRLARFVGAPAALLFSSGYAANVGVLDALLGADDLVLSDAANHASLIDGCRLARARVLVHPHGDLGAVEALLTAHRASARLCLVVTDAVFSMDGDTAPLAGLAALCEAHGADLYVDEAHALGVLGPGGAGASARAGIAPAVRIGTLGKAFGTAGAFVAGSDALVAFLENRARSFVYSTGPLPALAASASAAADLVAAADDRRDRLHRHAARLRAFLRGRGHDAPDQDGPIVPLVLGDPAAALDAARRLRDLGVFCPAIRPPTVPPGTSRLRLVPTAAHEDADLDQLLDALDTLPTIRRSRPCPDTASS